MLSLPALRNVLTSVISPHRIHTAVLFTPPGEIIAQATSNTSHNNDKDNLRVIVGLATEIWLEVELDGIGMVEGELGKIIILPLYRESSTSPSTGTRRSSHRTMSKRPNDEVNDPPLLVALNAVDGVDWAELEIKARAIVNYLAKPLAEFGDRLLPPPSPVQHLRGYFY